MIKKSVVMAILGVVLFSSAPAQARTLTVGGFCTNPPYGYKEPSGAIVGFDIDVAREIGKRMGADVAITCLPFQSLVAALLNKQFDVIFASMSITDERKKTMDFSLPYRSATGRFVGRKSLNVDPFLNGAPNPAALKGKTVGVIRSTTHDLYLQALFPGVEITRYDGVEGGLLDLQADRIDLFLTSPIKTQTDFLDKPAGQKYEFKGAEIIAKKYLGEGVAAGVRKGNTELLQEINKALQGMYDDGTFKAINLKYWKFSVMPEIWK